MMPLEWKHTVSSSASALRCGPSRSRRLVLISTVGSSCLHVSAVHSSHDRLLFPPPFRHLSLVSAPSLSWTLLTLKPSIKRSQIASPLPRRSLPRPCPSTAAFAPGSPSSAGAPTFLFHRRPLADPISPALAGSASSVPLATPTRSESTRTSTPAMAPPPRPESAGSAPSNSSS